eukprot:SAG31_NODE_3362_length_4364_cov_1.463540_4_plen_98_part_00
MVTAYSPLSGANLADPVIVQIAARHGVTPAVVVLRWLRQHGCIVLPKSLTPQRIADNLNSPRTFVLSAQEMLQLVRRNSPCVERMITFACLRVHPMR